jgi:plastocyanin
MRRTAIVSLLALATLSAGVLAAAGLGAGTGPVPAPTPAQEVADHAMHTAHAKAAPKLPKVLSDLDARFRTAAAKATCTAGATQAKRGRTLRAAALKNARGAKGKTLTAKAAQLRTALAAVNRARTACLPKKKQPAPGVAVPPAPGTPAPVIPAPVAPGPVTPTPPAGLGTIVTVTTGGTPFSFGAGSYTAPAGTVTVRLINNSDMEHNVGARANAAAMPFGTAPSVGPGGTTEITLQLVAGTYQVFCNYEGHDQLGMTAPLVIT